LTLKFFTYELYTVIQQMIYFNKIAMKSNKRGTYKQKLYGFSAKSAEFGYKCFFISSSKTFICKDILSTYLEQKSGT